MKSPDELPAKGCYWFYCTHIETGRVRRSKQMTVKHARVLNSHNHMRDTGYQWLFDDQYSFNDQLNERPGLIISG